MARADAASTTPKAPTALVSSARRINLRAPRKERIEQLGGPSEEWQTEVWAYYDTCPEFGQAIMYTGNMLAKLRLFPAVRENDDENAEPIPADDDDSGISPALAAEAAALLRSMKSPIGGQSEILRTIAMNLDCPGEGYLVYRAERVPTPEENALRLGAGDTTEPQTIPERWDVLSIDEITVTQRQTLVKLDGAGRGVALDPDLGDDLFRIWLRHPRWSTKADSAARHCLPVLRLLNALESQVLASTNSQMHSGILFLSSGMTVGGLPLVMPQTNEEHEQSPFEKALDESYSRPIEDPDDLMTVRPMVVIGAKDDIAASKFMETSRKLDEQMDDRIEKQVQRLARGVNLPVEVIMGHQATTFANAEQVDQDTFDDYLEPRARLIVDSLTMGMLRPLLLERGFDEAQVQRLIVWYDPGDLIANPDVGASADFGIMNDLIRPEAWRRARGWAESDAPDEEPEAEPTEPEPEVVDEEVDVDQEDPAPEAVVAAVGRRSPLGARLTDIDRRLYDRLDIAFSMAMDRAVERAASQLRSRIRNTPMNDLVASTPNGWGLFRRLGAALVADATGGDDLLAGAFASLQPMYRDNVGAAQRRARTTSADAAPIRDIDAIQEADLEEAWAWTEQELGAAANRALYADAEALGEGAAETRSSAGLIRQSMSRAGGSRGIDARGFEQGYVTTLAGTDIPAGGVALGTTITEALTDAGVQIEGYTWVWGDSSRPFDPHLDLDGTTYRSYDDAALTNTADWPPFPHYFPGDHLGCTCSAEPTLLGPDGEPI